jgi:hypothetical protein
MKKKFVGGILLLIGLTTLLSLSFAATEGTNSINVSIFDVSITPTGYLATLEFNSDTDTHYSFLRSSDLLSNDWNAVESDVPGTGTNMVFSDLTPLSSLQWFYKATSTAAPPVNLILNSGFEDPALASGNTNINASGSWVQVGNNQVIQKADWAAEEAGGQGVWLQGWAANLDREFYQDVSGTAGVEYTLDAGFNFNDNFESNGSTLEMAIIWLDGGGSEISRITLDVNANLNAAEGWKHLSISGTAPVGTATVRAWFHWTTDSNIENSSQSSALVDNVSLTAGILGGSVVSADWGSFGTATRVAAAQYAGHYAVADSSIEINTIDESVVDTITDGEIEALLTGAEINGIAFTPSGRQLFISANGTSSDSVLAYNAGTGILRNFVTGLSLASSDEKLGLAHFKGELFVGTSTGEIRRYDALLGDATGSYNASINFSGDDAGQPVRGIAVDIQDQMLYVASPNNLYRLDPTNSVLTSIATVSNMVDITFGRTYGAASQGGLLILQDDGNQRIVHRISTSDLQAGGSVVPDPYYATSTTIPSIASTACGRLLAAGETPCMLSDTNDTRMSFMEWVADEFDQNVLMAKILCWQDGGLTGMVQNSATRFGKNRGSVASPDAAFWVVNQLIMSDEVNGDPEAQGMVREIIKRHATLEVNTDGQWYHWYDSNDGLLSWGGPDYETSVYSTMKGVHMAIRAKAYYPDDTEIVDAANTIIGKLRNQRDYVRDFGKFASPADDLGPLIGGHRPAPYQEILLFSELMAAGEPMCENSHLDYWRYRDTHTYDYELPDEPIVRKNAAGFWRMYDQATISYCREDAEWKQEFKNFYALFAGWTDDNTPEHLTAFSAGTVPDTSDPDPASKSTYSADKYTSHPGTVNSFGTVIGFGLHGDTVPVVGAYFAYRDGRRQAMKGSANYAGADLLTRISYDYPTWVLQGISPTDHQYAGYALGEILAPGSIDNSIALHTYLEPQWKTEPNGDKTIEFARTVRRQVWGTADGSNWDFLGFQHSPFTVAAPTAYTNFAVVGAEGELLDPASETATEQDYDVAADFDDTIYIVRGVTASTTALVRAQWYNGGSFISEQTGSPDGLEATKPASATILRIALVESGTPVAAGQLSVVLDGALETFTNGNQGFELGNLSGWTTSAGSGMGYANVADSRLEGARACELTASIGANNGNEAAVFHEYDISGDPVNTHYVLEFDVLTENLQGSSLRTTLTVFDGVGGTVRTDYFDTFGNAHSQTVLSAGVRKRDANHETLRFQIRLRRDDKPAVTASERVLVDNLRLLKMQP